MGKKHIKIMSNNPELGSLKSSYFEVEHELMSTIFSFRGILKELRKVHNYHIILIDATPQLLIIFCLFCFLSPHRRWKLVSLDQNLIAPGSLIERAVAMFKRILFKKVDLFILYLRDITGYKRFYGISQDQAVYIPFKVNIWDLVGDPDKLSSNGDYVLVAGRSLRDLKTFIEAIRNLKYPTIILHQGYQKMRDYNTKINLENLPQNVKAVYHDGNQTSWGEFIRNARVVVIPTLPTITAAGVSVYLDAMALKKCVILSDNPASRGILKDEAIIVPPQNPSLLAEAIHNAWEDNKLRERIASAGREYANTMQDKNRLFTDIIECCARLVYKDI